MRRQLPRRAERGSRISISVDDAAPETLERIKAYAEQLQQVQLILRGKDDKIQEMKDDILKLNARYGEANAKYSELLDKAFSMSKKEYIFQGGVVVKGAFQTGDNSIADLRGATFSDNSEILALLEKILERRADLGLSAEDADRLKTEAQSANAESQKPSPNESILKRSVGILQKFASEAASKAADKIGEAASADLHTWLLQLTALLPHLLR